MLILTCLPNVGSLADGYTVHLGETRPGIEDPFAARWYVKSTDTLAGGGAYVDLPFAEHRARMEATFRGDLCPFRSLEEWRGFRFQRLSQYFRQVKRRPIAPGLPAGRVEMLQTLASSGYVHRLGRTPDPTKAAQHRRQGLRIVRADVALNKRIYDALRALTTLSERRSESPA